VSYRLGNTVYYAVYQLFNFVRHSNIMKLVITPSQCHVERGSYDDDDIDIHEVIG
jgi:hypothetical protein